MGFDKLARRARTQICTDDTQITGTPNYGVPSQMMGNMTDIFYFVLIDFMLPILNQQYLVYL